MRTLIAATILFLSFGAALAARPTPKSYVAAKGESCKENFQPMVVASVKAGPNGTAIVKYQGSPAKVTAPKEFAAQALKMKAGDTECQPFTDAD